MFELSTIGRSVVVASCLALIGTGAVAIPAALHAGPFDDGTAVIPVGFRVTPAGSQSPLGNLPLTAELFPDGRALLVVNAGQGVQSLQVVDPADGTVLQSIEYRTPEALFVGAAFSPDGTRAYVSAGGNNEIRTYDVVANRLTETEPIPLPTTNPEGKKVNMFPAELEVTPDGRRLVVADSLADAVTVIDLATSAPRTVAVEHTPYGVAVTPDGTTAYVSNQGASTLSVVDLTGAEPVVTGNVTVGVHPNRQVIDPEQNLLYVANADSDQVSVVDLATNQVTLTIELAPYRNAQVGTNPAALALSEDGRTLYVANSGNNDVAVVDTESGEVEGLIPTGWYPSALVATDARLLVVNAKGLGAGPTTGPGSPNPYGSTSPDKYIGSMMTGTLSRIELPVRHRRLDRWTEQVEENNGFADRGRVRVKGGTSVIPRRVGEPSPIKHVFYVVRENRTYDQELGSLGKGNGEASLNLFGDESAPNSRELARRYVTVDNFYANAEVSAQGWNWVVAGNSNLYTEQTWAPNYSSRNHPNPSGNNDPAIAPQRPDDAYIWQRMSAAGISFRNYGFYAPRVSTGQFVAADPVLNANTDHAFGGYNLSCPDAPGTFAPRSRTCAPTDRFTEWKREFDEYVASGTLPTVQLVRLPNDHTSGSKVGMPTPRAYVADNDWAIGQLVEAISTSPYWESSAIFITEDDAQNGPDHVDAHRTVALVVSPYTRTGRVDSTFYSTVSMLRTIELIVGLKPLTQFDAFATPMIASFTNRPDTTPYRAILPTQSFTEVNPVGAPLSEESARQDLSKEDQIDEQLFNQAIWKSVKGADSIMPAPRTELWGSIPNDQAEEIEDLEEQEP